MKSVFLGSFITRNKNSTLRDAICTGARKTGYSVKFSNNESRMINNKNIYDGDLLFIWNRHSGQDDIAAKFETRGGKVLSIENPYIKVNTEKWVSVGYGHHNNMGYAPQCLDSGERFKSFNKEIKPWKCDGENIVITTQAKVFNQSGLGVHYIRQPLCWDSETIETLKRKSNKPIVFRLHPNGKNFEVPHGHNSLFKNIILSKANQKNIPLYEDLKNAYALVTWNSNSATEALLEGVPVFYCAPHIITADCCNRGLHNINKPYKPNNRETVFNRIAWCQYSLKEVESGYFFDCISQ